MIHQPMPGLLHITLAPQFAFRPWNLFVQRGELGVWCYPMADESLDQAAGAPPRQLVRLVKALGDEKRLQILRVLSVKDSTLQDLTESLGMPKSTVHHHLLALRSAGLVRMTSGPDIRYILRREALSEPSGLLKAYLQDLA
jgi:DNA-binding transcriptional ArsR family regulator